MINYASINFFFFFEQEKKSSSEIDVPGLVDFSVSIAAFSFLLLFIFFIYLWLHWVFIAAHGLSPATACGLL